MGTKKFYLVAALALTVLSACSKTENPVNTGNNNNNQSGGTTEMGGNVLPAAVMTDVSGMFSTIMLSMDYGVPQIPDMNTVFGMAWLKEGMPAGISVNNLALTAQGESQGGKIFMAGPFIGDQAEQLPFDGSEQNWNIQGGGGLPSFTSSVSTPYGVHITSPLPQSTVSRSGFTVQWKDDKADNPKDMYFLSIYNQGKRTNIMDLGSSGSKTFSAAELTDFSSGQLQIQIGKVRYKIVGQGGKNYSIVAEYAQQNPVMLQ